MAAGRDQDTLIIAPLFHAAGSNGVLAALWNTGTQVTLRAVDPCAALCIEFLKKLRAEGRAVLDAAGMILD